MLDGLDSSAFKRKTDTYTSPWFDVTYGVEYPIIHNLNSDNVRITVEAKIISNPSSYTAIGEIFDIATFTYSWDNYTPQLGVIKKVVDANTVKIRTPYDAGASLGYIYTAGNNDNANLNWTNSTANSNVNHCQIRVKVEKLD
ncbi:MAG: hypothetical protein IE909_19055 [Campylobacterales bacterium]|nr:hypothetical protein [Campylobacterales bacterium]